MGGRLKAGVVTSLRINPKDCMSVVDVLDKTGLLRPGMSFSAMAALTLSVLLETMRERGDIPTRDGFEFSEMVGPYLNGNQSKKVAISRAVEQVGSDFSAPALPQQRQVPAVRETLAPVKFTPPDEDAAEKLTYLIQKKEMAESGAVDWTALDQSNYDRYYQQVYPHG
jgi:hypothetical protein